MNFRENSLSRFRKNRFLGFDPYAPCGRKFAYITLIDGVRKGYQRSCILLTVTPQHSRVRSRRESNNGIHARWLGEVEWRYLDNWNTITIQYLYIQYNTIQYLDNLECSNRMLVPELDLIIARSWNRQNDVTVTLNIARKKWKFQKERSLRDANKLQRFRSNWNTATGCLYVSWTEVQTLTGNYQKFPCRISFKFAWEVPTVDL